MMELSSPTSASIASPNCTTADLTGEEGDRIIDVDLRGVFLCMKHEIPLLRRQEGGVIENTPSGAGVNGIAGQAAYCAAKFDIVGLTEVAALDYARSQIRTNAVCPGCVDTPMMQRFWDGTAEGRQMVVDNEPAGRFATPAKIATAFVRRTSRSVETGFVLEALEQALHDRSPIRGGGLVHHSDHGAQYVSIR